MSDTYQTNTKIEWDWGDGVANGYVREVHRQSVTRSLKGSEVTRHGTDDNPAYLIEQSDGDEVLKLHSEIRPAGK